MRVGTIAQKNTERFHSNTMLTSMCENHDFFYQERSTILYSFKYRFSKNYRVGINFEHYINWNPVFNQTSTQLIPRRKNWTVLMKENSY
jgi:carotenoid cleavage dioxygenase-like enzyme